MERVCEGVEAQSHEHSARLMVALRLATLRLYSFIEGVSGAARHRRRDC